MVLAGPEVIFISTKRASLAMAMMYDGLDFNILVPRTCLDFLSQFFTKSRFHASQDRRSTRILHDKNAIQ